MNNKTVKLTSVIMLVLSAILTSNKTTAQAKNNVQADSINSYRSMESTDSIVFNPNLTYGTLTDIDGNIYKTITIGTQTWMAENLKTSHLNDKTEIKNVIDSKLWPALTTPAYCWYNNDTVAYKATYGALYNWLAVNTGKLAPAGWHVSSEDEWVTLANYLIANGYNFDGTTVDPKYAKSLASSAGWPHANFPGSVGSSDYPEKCNATGFTALPGGVLSSSGTFVYIGNQGFWWTSTVQSDKFAWAEHMFANYTNLIPGYEMKSCGLSVRCVKDSVSTTGVNLIESKVSNTVSLYPNPSNGIFNITIPLSALNAYIEVYNSTGTLIIKHSAIKVVNAFDLTNQLPGLYFMKVINENRIIDSQKIIKQ